MVCLDANVLLEIILERQNHVQARQAIASLSDKPCVSMLSLHLVVYFSRLAKVEFNTIYRFIDKVELLGLDETDYVWAKTNMRDEDFEDALQLAVAVRHGCDKFITFDKRLYDTYKSLPQLKIELVGSK